MRADAAGRAADAPQAPAGRRQAGTAGRREHRSRRRRWWLITLALLVLVALAAAVWWFFLSGGGGGQQQSQGRPPVTITAGEAVRAIWQPQLRAVGTISAYREVMVTAQVPGLVEEVAFESGEQVRQGEVLVMLNTDRDQAELEDVQANLQLARATLARQVELAEDGYASEAEVDEAQARFQSAQAQVNALRERIDDKVIKAPFGGELGIRRLNEGAYVQPGEPIVSLAQLDPLRVIFGLPQEQFAKVEKGQPVEVGVSAYPDRTFDGVVTAIDPMLSERTRTFTVEARLDNTDRALRPGMFADVTLILPARENVVTLPQTALSYNPYGDFVFVVEEADQQEQADQEQAGQAQDDAQARGGDQGQSQGPALVARRQFVTAGERRGTQIAIVEGVEAGQRVATSGLFKLQDGTPVRIDNSITPPSEADVQQVEY